MKITDIEARLISCPLPEPLQLPFHGGLRTILKRDAMVILVRTDSDLVGIAPGPAHDGAAREIDQHIKPFLLGRNPADWKSFQFEGPLALRKVYHAVEIALMDLHGKMEGCTVSDLFGGRKRPDIRLYGSAGMYMSPSGFAEEVAAIAALGFDAYKMRPALGMEKDLETVRLMREAVGPEVELMIDAHSWWRMGNRSLTEAQVTEMAQAMEPYRPAWLEEPLPPDDHDAYVRLREASPIPIASGEHEQTEEGFTDLMNRGCVDVVQMDVCCQGGFAWGERVFQQVRDHKLEFAFHSWGTLLELVAAAQLGACWDEDVVRWLEYPCYAQFGKPGMYAFPAAETLIQEPLQIEQSRLILPTGPGLGVELREEVFEEYPWIPGPWSIFRIDDPPETVAVTGDHSVKWVEGSQ